MTRFLIRRLPAFTDWKGNAYADRFGVSLVCSRGLRWDGGEFPTREQAVAAGAARVSA